MKNNYEKEGIKRVKNIVLHHEIGGDEESDQIKDADSISYFEVNAKKHIHQFGDILGKGKTQRKFDWMFERISSKKARAIAKPLYEKVTNMMNATFSD